MKLLTRDRRSLLAPQMLKVMKLTFILLTAAFLHVSANGHSQTVTFSGKDVPLLKVFAAIKSQTGYVFFYDANLLQEAKPVTLNVKNETLENVLEQTFKDQPFSWSMVNKTITITRKPIHKVVNPSTEKQVPIQVDVKGRVITEDGEPVEGATITLKGANIGTTTDANGYFVLKGISENATLIISGVNIELREVKIGTKSELLSVVVKSKITIGETVNVKVNTGYQTNIPKERITGSFQHLDNKTLNLQISTGILDRLEGVSSVLFDKNGNRPSMTLRGLSSINGPKDMLIILDNFPYEGELENINPNEIASITLLKDAAATSVWGARAGNGVIVITTIKSKFNQPLKISLNASTTIVPPPDLFKLPLISSKDYIQLERYLFSKGYRFSDTNSINKPPFTPVYEILFRQRSGQITSQQADTWIAELEKIDYRSDMEKYLYQPGINQQYSLNITGGIDRFAWLLSGGYDHNISEKNAMYKRTSLRWESRWLPVRNMQFTAGLTFTNSMTEVGRPSYNGITYNGSSLYPYAKLADENGNALPIVKTYRQLYKDTTGMNKLMNWNYYPLDDYKHISNTSRTRHWLANIKWQYQILKGLNISLIYQHESQDGDGWLQYGINSFYTRDMINRFTVLNRTTGAVTYNLPQGDIVSISSSSMVARNARGQLNYTKTFGKHYLTAMAGTEIREIRTKSNSNTVYGYDSEHAVASNVDFINTFPSYINGSSLSITNGLSFSETLNRFISGYANVAYTWNNRYIMTISGRKDASNLFGVNTNQKWNPLWSAGVGWNISNESFYNWNVFPYLKFRATTGFSGNMDARRSAVTVLRYSIAPLYTNYPIAVVSQFANPELSWEKVRMINLALEFASQNEIFSGSLEFFVKKATGLFGPSPVDQTAGLGVSSVTKNVASMKGKGGELLLNIKNRGKKLKWNCQVIANYYKDQVTDYYIANQSGNNFVSSGTTINPFVGKPVYSVFAYRWAGLSATTGDPLGYWADTVSSNYSLLTGSGVTVADLAYKGQATPVFHGSFRNTLTWKGISCTISFLFKMGHVFRRESFNYGTFFSTGQGHSDFAYRWQKPGDEQFTDVPSLVYPAVTRRDQFYNSSEILVENAGLIRLQFITFGYNFPASLLTKLKLDQLSFYATGSGLGLVWRANKKGLDPEYPGLSQPKSFSLGLRLSF